MFAHQCEVYKAEKEKKPLRGQKSKQDLPPCEAIQNYAAMRLCNATWIDLHHLDVSRC